MSELLKYVGQTVQLEIDRPLGSSHPIHGFTYPVNYGYVPHTQAPDAEEIDGYVLGVHKPLRRFEGICIAVVWRRNDLEDKLVLVPPDVSFTDREIAELVHFQEQFFDSMILRSLPSP